MPVADPAIPTSLITVLIIAVTALAGVVGFLFKHYQGKLAEVEKDRRDREAQQAQERAAWALERTRLEREQENFELRVRAEFEAKHRAMLDNQVKMTSEIHEAAREQETTSRREFAATMEMVADKSTEASEKVAAVLDKFLDRFVTGRRKG
jgi:ATPase subunit of ABC transporter with duplicated ATPase domains